MKIAIDGLREWIRDFEKDYREIRDLDTLEEKVDWINKNILVHDGLEIVLPYIRRVHPDRDKHLQKGTQGEINE